MQELEVLTINTKQNTIDKDDVLITKTFKPFELDCIRLFLKQFELAGSMECPMITDDDKIFKYTFNILERISGYERIDQMNFYQSEEEELYGKTWQA